MRYTIFFATNGNVLHNIFATHGNVLHNIVLTPGHEQDPQGNVIEDDGREGEDDKHEA